MSDYDEKLRAIKAMLDHEPEPWIAFKQLWEGVNSMGTRPKRERRGRPATGQFIRSTLHWGCVRAIMHKKGVGITQAVKIYSEAANLSRDHVWAAVRRCREITGRE